MSMLVPTILIAAFGLPLAALEIFFRSIRNEVSFGKQVQLDIKVVRVFFNNCLKHHNQRFDELKSEHRLTFEAFLSQLGSARGSYFVENKTMEFLKSVAPVFVRGALPAYYYKLNGALNISSSWKMYGQYVNKQIRAKVESIEKLEAEQKNRNDLMIADAILKRHETKVLKFLEIAYRKVAALDDYGDENHGAFDAELIRFLKKLAEHEDLIGNEMDDFIMRFDVLGKCSGKTSVTTLLVKELKDKFESYCQGRKIGELGYDSSVIAQMAGVDFEQYLTRVLEKCGALEISGTPVIGDQGADILFSFCNMKIVVQAKRYNASVGNKAVQEAHAAKGYYRADFAWVITNSIFTNSAKELASQLGVFLIDGVDLANFKHKFDNFFSDRKNQRIG